MGAFISEDFSRWDTGVAASAIQSSVLVLVATRVLLNFLLLDINDWLAILGAFLIFLLCFLKINSWGCNWMLGHLWAIKFGVFSNICKWLLNVRFFFLVLVFAKYFGALRVFLAYGIRFKGWGWSRFRRIRWRRKFDITNRNRRFVRWLVYNRWVLWFIHPVKITSVFLASPFGKLSPIRYDSFRQFTTIGPFIDYNRRFEVRFDTVYNYVTQVTTKPLWIGVIIFIPGTCFLVSNYCNIVI